MIYQTTRLIWNLLRTTTANDRMCYDIFRLFVGENKKRKPVMEGNCRLNIKIDGHIADLYCLFEYCKTYGLFYLLLFHYVKTFFFLVVGRKKCLPFHRRNVDFADRIVLLESKSLLWYHYELYFPAVAMWYSRSLIMTMKSRVHECFRPTIFKIHLQKAPFWKILRYVDFET